MEGIQDIPKLYTALAEWLACVVCVWCCRKFIHKGRLWLLLPSLGLLGAIQLFCGTVDNVLWIIGMMVAAGVMFVTIWQICEIGYREAMYLCMRGFMVAEFIAALEWQMDYYFRIYETGGAALSWIMCLGIYALLFIIFAWAEYRVLPKFVLSAFQPVSTVQLCVTVTMTVFFFAFSNLSYISSDLPFTGRAARGIFNSRTLIDFAGVGVLFGYNLSRLEEISRREAIALRATVERQYQQYLVAQETREIINRKYHDLKHQLAIIRANPLNSMAELDAFANGLSAYETDYDTGNTVLDAILSEKGRLCREKQIEFAVMADGSLLNGLKTMDICAIFGNAIDNAIECEEKIENERLRRIRMMVSERNEFIHIQIENYCETEPRFRTGMPLTSKADACEHGFGTHSIRASVETYGGVLQMSWVDSIFYLKALIPKP